MPAGPKDPKQTVSNKDHKSDKKKKPGDALSDKDLDEASGGAGHRIEDRFSKITGPSWVKLMAYRKAGWSAEPERKRSLVDLHKELETESTDEE